jgi:hypothetical protein
MESWDHREGEVWVDCEAAHAAFESAKANYGKQVQQDLETKNLGPGHSSRIRGRADGARQRYARIQRTNVTNFAGACRADADKLIVDKAIVREWMQANPPDETKPVSDKTPISNKAVVNRSRMIITAAAILATAAIALAVWKLLPGQHLAISQLRVYDDSYRAGQPGRRTLTALQRKKAAFYQITTTDEFLLSLGFVISGYAKKSDGGINVEAAVVGKGVDSDAWQVDYKFTRPDDWTRMDVPESVGSAAVLGEFNLRDEAALPVITLIECAQVDELARWTGRVEIKVTDRVGDQKASDSITINLNKPGNLTPPSNCAPKP